MSIRGEYTDISNLGVPQKIFALRQDERERGCVLEGLFECCLS